MSPPNTAYLVVCLVLEPQREHEHHRGDDERDDYPYGAHDAPIDHPPINRPPRLGAFLGRQQGLHEQGQQQHDLWGGTALARRENTDAMGPTRFPHAALTFVDKKLWQSAPGRAGARVGDT